MEELESLRELVASFEGVRWASAGVVNEREGSQGLPIAWVKFQAEKSENGWRVIEFFAWCLQTISRNPPQASFFPISAPPTLNEPGDCLCFVLEIEVGGGEPGLIGRTVAHLAMLKEEDWPECKA